MVEGRYEIVCKKALSEGKTRSLMSKNEGHLIPLLVAYYVGSSGEKSRLPILGFRNLSRRKL